MADDPFPRERVGATLRRVPAYLKLAWRLARDPLLSRARRAAVIGAAGYLASPVDLVPGIIPIAGQLDDIAVAIAALKFALAGLDPQRRRAHLEAVGLDDGALGEDLRTLGVASAWLVRAGARTTGRVARKGGAIAVTGARVAGRVVSKGAPAAKDAASKAAPAAREGAARAGSAVRGAAAKAAPAAKDAATKGVDAVKGIAGRRPAVRVRVLPRDRPALGPGHRPTEETLVVEADAGAGNPDTPSGPAQPPPPPSGRR